MAPDRGPIPDDAGRKVRDWSQENLWLIILIGVLTLTGTLLCSVGVRGRMAQLLAMLLVSVVFMTLYRGPPDSIAIPVELVLRVCIAAGVAGVASTALGVDLTVVLGPAVLAEVTMFSWTGLHWPERVGLLGVDAALLYLYWQSLGPVAAPGVAAAVVLVAFHAAEGDTLKTASSDISERIYGTVGRAASNRRPDADHALDRYNAILQGLAALLTIVYVLLWLSMTLS